MCSTKINSFYHFVLTYIPKLNNFFWLPNLYGKNGKSENTGNVVSVAGRGE